MLRSDWDHHNLSGHLRIQSVFVPGCLHVHKCNVPFWCSCLISITVLRILSYHQTCKTKGTSILHHFLPVSLLWHSMKILNTYRYNNDIQILPKYGNVWKNIIMHMWLKRVEEDCETGLGSVIQLVIVPSSSSMVLPFVVSLNPRILLNRMEKALPHTPVQCIQTHWIPSTKTWYCIFDHVLLQNQK